MTSTDAQRRAQIVGTGLIGGSIALALRERGWFVTGTDRDESRAKNALVLGALDAVGIDDEAEIAFVATPVSEIPTQAAALLGHPSRVVTDVGSVKSSIVDELHHPRFVGGHPMAGSEMEGIEGAQADMFEGATWVLTPTRDTENAAFTLVQSVVTSLGAEVLVADPADHDRLVAMVSHVPHLAATALMTTAADQAAGHELLLRLAAGGFRDMTRIAASHPAIWLDICAANAPAISEAIGRLQAQLEELQSVVATGDRTQLKQLLERARRARLSLPSGAPPAEQLAEIRVLIPDRPGVLAEVTALAGTLGVNISDIEVAHSAEGPRGLLVLVVRADRADEMREDLRELGYRPAVEPLA